MAGTTPIPQGVQPGQQTAIPASNYDINKDLGRVIDRTNVVNAPTAPNLLFNSGVPIGTDGSQKVNSVYAAYLGALKNTPTNFLTTPKFTNKATADPYLTDNYGGFNPDDKNITNWYGENQSWLKQWGNRIGKLGVTTLGSFANSLMDIPNMISAVHEGNLDKIWNNPTNTWATDMQNWAENAMPNYETNWEREHPFLNLVPFYGNSANGWGNVLQQTGFTIGAIGGAIAEDFAVGAVTGGTGEIPLAAMQINKAVYRLGKLINMGEEGMSGLKNSIKSADDIIKGLRGIDRLNYVARKGLWGANMITSGFSEAAFEGLDGFNQINKDLTQEYFNENGRMPDYDSQQKIYNTAQTAGNTRFLLNAGLLAVTNSIQWGSLLKPFNVAKDAIEAEAKAGVSIALKEGSRDVFEAVQPTSKFARIAGAIGRAKPVELVKESLSEGFEEGAQFAIQTGVDDYYKRKYHEPSINQTNNFLKSFGLGLSKTLGTQEGWENIIYGILGGAMYSGGEHIYHKLRGIESPNYQKQVQDVLNGLNTNTLTGIFENKYGEQVAADAIQDDMLSAAKNNNLFLYKNYQHEQLVNFVLSGIRQNKYDTRIEQLDELNKLNQDDFQQMFGIPQTTENKKTVADYVGQMKGMAEYIKEINDRVDRTFINPFNYKGTGNYKNSEQKANQDIENEKYLVFEDAKDQLTYSMTVARNANDRIAKMRSEMSINNVNVNEAEKLGSDRGLREMKGEILDRISILNESVKLGDKNAQKEKDKLLDRISLIDESLDASDPENSQKAYNQLVNSVFDGYQDMFNQIYKEKNSFPRVIQKEIMDKSRDIAYLQARTEKAVDNYARLTTKGGFKKLFDNIAEIRKSIQERNIKLAPENTQPQNPQVDAQAKKTDIQNGQTPGANLAFSQQQGQGELSETTQELDDEQKKQYYTALLNAVDGKEKYPSEELDNVDEFSTLDDLKMTNSKVNLADYKLIKSSDGKNYYIHNTVVNAIRNQLKAPTPANPANLSDAQKDELGKLNYILGLQNKDGILNENYTGIKNYVQNKLGLNPSQRDLSEIKDAAQKRYDKIAATVPPTPPTPNTPTPSGDGNGKSALRTEDYLNKVFVPEDLKDKFQKFILAIKNPANFVKHISITVQPLSPDQQTAYDQQKSNKNYTSVKGYPGVFVSKAPIDLSISFEGNEIGKMVTPDRLLFQQGNQLVTLDKITPQEYSNLTSKPAAQYASDLEQYNNMVALKNVLAVRFKNNNLQPITLSPDEVEKLMDIKLTYGELDLVTKDEDRPTYDQLNEIKNIRIKDSLLNLIISIPRVYSNDVGGFVKTDHMNFIYNQFYYDNASNIDTKPLEGKIASDIASLHAIGSRYIAVTQTPDGAIRYVALRPAAISEHTKERLFNSLKSRSTESAELNFNESDEKNADGKLLIGDQTVYYKYASDDAKKYNDDYNTTINSAIFVSDPNGKNDFTLSVSPIGAVRMEVYNKDNKKNYTLYIAPQRMENVKDFKGMIDVFNKEATKLGAKDAEFKALNINFAPSNFRESSVSDRNATTDELGDKLTASTTPNILKNGTMRITPNAPAVNAAYKEARGVQQNATQNQQAADPNEEDDTKLNRLFDAQEAIAPAPIPIATKGIFGGLTQVQTDDTGMPVDMVSPQEVADAKGKQPVNQENLSDIEFPNVTQALASMGISFYPSNEGTVFTDVETGEVLDNLAGITPIALAESMGLKVAPTKTKSDVDFDFKLGENGVPELNRMLNIEKARQYISANLPSFIKVEDVNNVLDKISVKGEVFGAFSNGVIYLNESAEKGTEYHEAFHAVFRMLLDDNQIDGYLKEGQKGLYNQLRKDGKSITQYLKEKRDLGLYNNLSNNQALDRLYEEYMADRFADWKNKKESAGFFGKLFDMIRNFFKWFRRSGSDLDMLFHDIDTGVYRYSNIAANRFITDTENSTDEDYGEPEVALSLIPARPGVMQVGKGQITLKRNLDAKTSKQVVQNVASYYNSYRMQERYSGLTDETLLNTIMDDLKSLYSVDNPLYAGKSEAEMSRIANSDNAYIYASEDSRDIIKKGAKEYINTIKYIEQFRDEDQEDNEQDTGAPSTGYDNSSENVGGFSSLPGLLRQYIGFTSYEKVDEFGNKEVVEGVPTIATVDSVAVYYGIMRSVANITDPVKFFQKMVLFSNGNEQSRHFVEKFIKDTGLNVNALLEENRLEAITNPALVEMVKKGFNKFRIDYIFTEQDTSKKDARSYHANRKNVENTQFDKWSNEYANNYANYSEDAQKNIRSNVEDIRNQYFDERKNTKYNAAKITEAVNRIGSSLSDVGIRLSPEYIKYSLLAQQAAKFDKKNEAYKKEGVELQFDDPENKFIDKKDYDYVQIMKTSDETTLGGDTLEQLSKLLAAGSNPYYKDLKEVEVVDENTNQITKVNEEIDTAMIGRLLNIAKGNSLFDETVGESSYTNAENKIVYAHQDGTFNVKFSYQLRDAAFRQQLRELGYREATTAYRDAYDSDWLTKNRLLNSVEFEAIADNLLFNRIDGLRPVETNKLGKVITSEFRDQKEGITYGHYSPREFLVNFMNVYVSYAQTQRSGKGTFVTTPHLIRVLEASKTGDTVNLPILSDTYRSSTVTDKTKNLMFDEFKKEFDRIARVTNELALTENKVENYHTGSFEEDGYTVAKGYRGLKFTDNMTALLPKTTLDRMEKIARSNQEISSQDQAYIKDQIATSLNKMVDDTLNLLVREGVVNQDSKGNFTNVFLHKDFFSGNESLNLGKRFADNIGHLVINNYLNTLSYNQILHGDSALSLKNDNGIDAVKRAKGDNAAIVSMRTDLIAPELGITQPFTHSNIGIFKEPIAADGTKIADAQMYTTVNGLRYTLWGLAKLTPRVAKVLDALENGENIHALKKENGKTFDAIFDNDNGLLKWDEMTNSLKLVYKDGKSYFKMSVVVLQPSLTSFKDKEGNWKAIPGWETLHNLRTKMEQSNIHFSAPESASKMMTMDVAKSKNFSDLVGHPYDNQYFGLQTANPSNKLVITTPTQLVQLIDSEQSDDTEVSLAGKNTTIGEIRNSYQNAVANKVSNDYNAARNEIYDIADFNKDINESIAKGEVIPRLAKFQERAISTLESTGGDAQLLDFFSLDENGLPKYNLNLSATKAKFQQLYLAYFSKGVLSQKTPGYTVALFSGIDTKTIRRAKRIVDGNVVEWDHIRRDHYINNRGGVQRENILGSREAVTEVGQLYLDELQHNVEEYDEEGNPTGRMYSEMMLPPHYKEFLDIDDTEQIPEAIATGFGVRIPSQDKHSFMSLRMVDFLPANLGSTGMFAKDLVRLSGADFDIDKEYISRYDFYTRYQDGKPQFFKYGSATTNEGKWEQYKQWMKTNNKTLKSAIAEITGAPDTSNILLSDEYTPEEKQQVRDAVVEEALASIGLPNTLEKFIEASKTRELNNGVLSNNIVDSYISLLTNKGMREIANTPATLDALAEIQKNEELVQRDKQGNITGTVFGKKTGFPVDSLGGQYYAFKNNTTGKDNIGIDVNANLIYSILNKGNTTLNGVGERKEFFTFDGVEFNSFGGNREYNLATKQFDGRRTNDILSTLISSATDEAKEQLNALYGLSVDALKVVNYMVGLKVPLTTAIYMINQPAIRNYLDIKQVKSNTLQTSEEEKLFRDDFRDEALARLDSSMKDYKELSDDDLFNTLQQSGMFELKCD